MKNVWIILSKINDEGRVTSTRVSFLRKQDRIHPYRIEEIVETRLKLQALNGHLRPELAAEDHFNDDTMNPRPRKQRLRHKNEGIYVV